MPDAAPDHGGITAFHAKYFAQELTRRCASDNVEKLASVLANAQVDLNPHQVEAALFAFRSPFSKGAILADEVGLGKTIEAGLLLAQKWAERSSVAATGAGSTWKWKSSTAGPMIDGRRSKRRWATLTRP
jgi:SNF2 family DNA or RNA helicase